MTKPYLKGSRHTRRELKTSADFRFAASVAGFGLSLRDSKYLGDYDMNKLIGLAKSGLGDDEGGYRAEFVRLVQVAKELTPKQPN